MSPLLGQATSTAQLNNQSLIQCYDSSPDLFCVGANCDKFGFTATTRPTMKTLVDSQPSSMPVIAIVMHNQKNSLSDGYLKTKTLSFIASILEQDPNPLHFVIVTDWQTKTEHEILNWFTSCHANFTATSRTVIIEVVEIPETRILQAITDLNIQGKSPLTHHSGLGGITKFFLPDVLEHHRKVIVYDTDVVVGKPISLLWDHFDDFSPQHLIATTNLMTSGGYEKSVCSCLSLMNLERMREIGWVMGHTWLETLFKGRELPGKAGIGDQALNSMIYMQYPQSMLMLPRIWMLSLCQHLYGYKDLVGIGEMKPRGGDQSWGAIHFNCEPPAGHAEWPEWRKKFTQPYRIRDYFDTKMMRNNFQICPGHIPVIVTTGTGDNNST